jgi:DNA helicase HerA-like ATPase
MTIADYEPSKSEEILLKEVFEQVSAGEVDTIQDVINIIEESEGIQKMTKKKVQRVFEQLEKQGVIGDQFPFPDFTSDMLEGQVPVLNVSGIELSSDANRYALAITAVLLRTIFKDKKTGRIPRSRHLAIYIDEEHAFCPKNGKPSSKEAILDLYKLSRSETITIIGATQNAKHLPEFILFQCDWKFFPHNFSPTEAIEIMKEDNPGDYDYPVNYVVMIRQLMGQMKRHKDGSRDWLFVDKNTGGNTIFIPYAPLSAHKTEG